MLAINIMSRSKSFNKSIIITIYTSKGLVLIMLSRQDRPRRQSEEHNCTVGMVKNLLWADCSYGKIKSGEVPQDLDINIQALDISHNKVKKLDSHSFKKYQSLVFLKMCMMTRFKLVAGENEEMTKGNRKLHIVDIEQDAFIQLRKLEYLEISDTFYGSRVSILWPPTIQELVIYGLYLSIDPIIHKLTRLVYLNAADNDMTVLPKFYTENPVIKEVNFTKNPLKMLTVQELAPLCTLQTLFLDTLDINTTFNKESAYCECHRIIKWFNTYKISGLSKKFSCYKYGADKQPPKCNLKFDLTLLETRRQCIGDIKLRTETESTVHFDRSTTLPSSSANETTTTLPPSRSPLQHIPRRNIFILFSLIALVILLAIAFIVYMLYETYRRIKEESSGKTRSALDFDEEEEGGEEEGEEEGFEEEAEEEELG